MNHREEVHGELVEAGRQSAALLEPAHALLDGAALPLESLVEAVSAVLGVLVAAAREDDADRVLLQPLADPEVAVTVVAGQALGTGSRRSGWLADAYPVHDLFELSALVDLPGRDMRREGESVTVSNQVELAAGSAARATQCVVSGLLAAPFSPAPAATREARTVEPSAHQRSQSMCPSASSRICRASRIRSKTFVRRQELKW